MDGTITGLTFTSTTPNLILTPTIKRSITTTGTPNNYNVNFTTTNPIPSNGVILITFPPQSDAIVYLTATVGNIVYNATSNTVTVNNLCNPGGCTASSLKIITLDLTYVKNIGWIKSPLSTSTDSWQILTTQAGYYIDQLTTGIIATPSLTTNVVTITSVSRSSDLINAIFNALFSITFTKNPIPTGGYLVITLPADTMYNSKYVMTSYSSTTQVISSNTLYSGTSQIQTMTIYGCPNATSCANSST